ncbi:sulfotransferase [Gaetbulibacter jejuensis]|uniref:sulfotransferase family protein n=1 Tax=Gaetbulibacter jejuensis TaxID=584607 RepID=UPI00300AC056
MESSYNWASVNLFVPGAGKSGTTYLHELLNCHPNISMSSIKEPSFWVNKNFERYTKEDIEAYSSLFINKENVSFLGESSTAYMTHPLFIERIKKHSRRNTKFIFVLRNPIDRVYSHYSYLKGIGLETLKFKKAILRDKDIEPSDTAKLFDGKEKNYYQYGLYGKWLSKFYETLGKENIKIILFEELINEPLEVINDCFSFLDLKSINALPNNIATNKTKFYKRPKINIIIKKLQLGKYLFVNKFNKYIPKLIRNFIKKTLNKLNTIEEEKKNKTLSIEDRIWIRDMYKNDIQLLKKISNRSFSLWQDFN